MLDRFLHALIRKREHHLGVSFDYVHKIAETDLGLLLRYRRIFKILDPKNHLPTMPFHVARLRAALAADCGTCVDVEINLAQQNGIDPKIIDTVLRGEYCDLPKEVCAIAQLTDAVVAKREDDAEARAIIVDAYGMRGLVEASLIMNCTAMLPGIKRAMGYATSCKYKSTGG